jgi:alkane 1-monooxygenase
VVTLSAAPSTSPTTALYWLSLLAPLLTLSGNLVGGPLVFAAGALVWIVYPALELLRIDSPKTAPLSDRRAFDLLLAVHVLVQLANIAALGWLAARSVEGWVLAGAIFSTGTTTGTSAFIVAHELMHRPTVGERLGSWVLLMTCLNTHFHVEHVHVHHRKVGTDEDPASARATDNTFTFIVRATVGQFLHAWQIAARKYPEQKGGPRLPYLTAMVRALVINLLAIIAMAALSPPAALAFLAQAVVATFMLNVVNYVEHWGLRRTSAQPVTPAHSWDTRSVVTRYTLFDLGMHADHHFRASKPYWQLQEHEEAPEMPVGLYAATVLSLCPPLFRALFSPALDAHRRAQVSG